MQRCTNCKLVRHPGEFIGVRGKPVRTCLTCRQSAKCSCGIKRSLCQKCGGGGLCECGIERSSCKKCGGGSYCECGVRRSSCKKCGGGSYCECEIRRTLCKEHGGGAYCPCDKMRSLCKEHGGGSLCECEIRRTLCKEHRKQKRARSTTVESEYILDPFQEFLATKCTRGAHVYISKNELEYAYRTFLDLQPEDFDAIDFQRQLTEDGISLHIKHLESVYYGVTLLF